MIKKNAFHLISGKENMKRAEVEVMEALGVAHKNTVTRRKEFTPEEKSKVEEIFKKYGVKSKIWE